MSQQRLDMYNQAPLFPNVGTPFGANTISANTIHLGNTTITEADIEKFRKMLGFMEFALAASEDLRNLMVAYEAKQRLLK